MKAAAVHKKPPGKLMNDGKWAWIMLLPNILGFFMFMLVPVVATFVLSFTKYDMLTKPKFIGLGNYTEMIHDPIVWQVTGNTILYTALTVPVDLDCGGLKVGLQIVGRQGDDERVCAFGAQLEHSLAATRPAPKHKKSA